MFCDWRVVLLGLAWAWIGVVSGRVGVAAETAVPGRIAANVLVIATYEMDDVPGELQYGAKRERLDMAVAGLDHPLLINGRGLYAMVNGTTARCAIQMLPSLEADYRVGSVVVEELLGHWARYRDQVR